MFAVESVLVAFPVVIVLPRVPVLEFPGTRTNDFHDYHYFSIAVATTFGATDVNVTTARMRRVVNFHTVLTFLYNSVIVATLAAILID